MSRPAGQFNVRKKIMLGYLRKFPNGMVHVKDEELAKQMQQSARHVSRILQTLKDEGAIEIKHRRFKHPTLGWCNTRTIQVKEL